VIVPHDFIWMIHDRWSLVILRMSCLRPGDILNSWPSWLWSRHSSPSSSVSCILVCDEICFRMGRRWTHQFYLSEWTKVWESRSTFPGTKIVQFVFSEQLNRSLITLVSIVWNQNLWGLFLVRLGGFIVNLYSFNFIFTRSSGNWPLLWNFRRSDSETYTTG
jgi:hypothetical protein